MRFNKSLFFIAGAFILGLIISIAIQKTFFPKSYEKQTKQEQVAEEQRNQKAEPEKLAVAKDLPFVTILQKKPILRRVVRFLRYLEKI